MPETIETLIQMRDELLKEIKIHLAVHESSRRRITEMQEKAIALGEVILTLNEKKSHA